MVIVPVNIKRSPLESSVLLELSKHLLIMHLADSDTKSSDQTESQTFVLF
jgi:hypothetical protein